MKRKEKNSAKFKETVFWRLEDILSNISSTILYIQNEELKQLDIECS